MIKCSTKAVVWFFWIATLYSGRKNNHDTFMDGKLSSRQSILYFFMVYARCKNKLKLKIYTFWIYNKQKTCYYHLWKRKNWLLWSTADEPGLFWKLKCLPVFVFKETGRKLNFALSWKVGWSVFLKKQMFDEMRGRLQQCRSALDFEPANIFIRPPPSGLRSKTSSRHQQK